MPSLIERLTRQKVVTFEDTELKRVLTTLDLTALGIGSTVGVGFYVLAGQVARNLAGPAVTISFLIAAVASVLAGICYAEFGARVPKAGSAYIYSYVCVGEFVAFVIGWNLILEYVIGASSVARGYSGYIDELTNNSISSSLSDVMPINVKNLSPYPDFLAFGLVIVLSIALAIGVKDSSRLNNVFTFINLFVIGYVIIAGATKADPSNWSLDEDDLWDDSGTGVCQAGDYDNTTTGNDWGHGGFAPYGFSGIMRGAATCFFGFVGFDVIATTGEEAINPSRAIPTSITLCLTFVFLAYFGASTVLTLGMPYCLQDVQAPIVYYFEYNGMEVSKWIVSIGALFGFSASLFGSMFPIPRIIYSMAEDGLLFRVLSKINKHFHTPLIATIIAGIFSGIMAMLFDIDDLMDMMNIGTLLAYTIVAICVMLLRYANDEDQVQDRTEKSSITGRHSGPTHTWSDVAGQMFNVKRVKQPTSLTVAIATWATLSYTILCFALSLLLVLLHDNLTTGDVASIIVVSLVAALTILNIVVIYLQPESHKKLSFKVPFVPWTTALSSFINFYLMCNLSSNTWVRFAVWMIVGLAIYFLYGMCHSKEEGGMAMPEVAAEEASGHDNYGAVVIPQINIVPATPGNSRPNTVQRAPERHSSIIESAIVTAESNTSPPNRRYQPAIPSPLVTSESNDSVDNFVTNGDVRTVNDDNLASSDNNKIAVDANIAISTIDAVIEVNTAKDSIQQTENNVDSKSSDATEKVEFYLPSSNSIQSIMKSEEPGLGKEYKSDLAQNNVDGINLDKGVNSAVVQNNAEGVSVLGILNKVDSVHKTDQYNDDNNNNTDTKGVTEAKSYEKDSNVNDPGTQDVVLRRKNISEESSNTEDKDAKSEIIAKIRSAPIIINHNTDANPAFISHTSSVPSTPVQGRRHPFKKLIRSSSFDDIPPSSPDSPGARRYKQFIIIPVKHLDEDSSMTSSPLASSNDRQPNFSNHSTFNELHNKLKILGDLENIDAGKNISTEDSSKEPLVPEVFVSGPAREFKRVIDKEVTELDIIRERGESKLSAYEHQEETVPSTLATTTSSIEPTPEGGSNRNADNNNINISDNNNNINSSDGNNNNVDNLKEIGDVKAKEHQSELNVNGEKSNVDHGPSNSGKASSTPDPSSEDILNKKAVAALTALFQKT